MMNLVQTFFIHKKYKSVFDKVNHPENCIIELMGPPGVGKTTYGKMLAKSIKTDSHIILAEEVKNLLSTKLRSNILFGDFHNYLFRYFLNYIQSNNEPIKENIFKLKHGLMEFECDALSTCFNGFVINDEGISHHFTGLILDLQELTNFEIILKKYLYKRVIVFLKSPQEVILQQIKDRQIKQNHVWKGHRNLTDIDILDLTARDIQSKVSLINLFKHIRGSSVIEIDVSQDFLNNIELIINFIIRSRNLNL